jgi:acetyl esterase
MPVLPEIVPMLEAANGAPPPPLGLSVADKRALANGMMEQSFLALAAPGAAVAGIRDLEMPVDGGSIGLRVYTPEGSAPFPCHVYFHGGGFWMGEPRHFDNGCQDTAAGAGCVVVSVDYRLAPEHKFPTAAEDCYAALRWTVDHADELGIDTSKVSIGGGSAGGNLTAVVALMARDRGGPPIVLQVIEIPVVDLTMSYPSIDENGKGYILTRESMEEYRGYYVTSEDEKRHPYASPIFADDLSGLPPALVMTAEFDPLRDEGEAYAARLRESGVPTTAKRWDGHIHGSMTFTAVSPSARQYRDEVVAALRRAYTS